MYSSILTTSGTYFSLNNRIPKPKLILQFKLLHRHLNTNTADMADKVRLTQLATDIQKAVDAYDPKDMSFHRKIQTALETMQSMIRPPEIAMIEQRFRVRALQTIEA